MSAPFERRSPAARRVGTNGFLRLALRCARNVYAASDRRMPEGRALAIWLGQTASALGLAEAAVPDDEALHRAKRRGVASGLAQDRRGAGGSRATSAGSADAPIDRWLAKIAETLSLDPLETEILALALHYRLDQRVERLFDRLSDCRGGPIRFQRDAALIALLLQASTAAVAFAAGTGCKAAGERAAACGAGWGIAGVGAAHVADAAGHTAGADLYDQLLGKMTAEPLPWDAFAHLGREAEVAASVLRAALAGQEIGVNILLYGPPGTGKTSFAATLAARIGANLRPVAEADEDGGEPVRHERLAGLRLAQRLAASRNTLLLFDEAEDLFVGRSIAFDEP